MKYRVGACALMFVLAGCSGEGPDSSLASLRGSAASGTDAKLAVSLPASRESGKSIANVPDRGVLVSYGARGAIAKRTGAYTWHPVSLSEAHAFRSITSGELVVPTPNGERLKVRYERHIEGIEGNWSWVGRVVGGDQMKEAIITFGEKAVFGSIPQLDGKPALKLQTREGRLWVVETDPTQYVSPNVGHDDIMIPPATRTRAATAAPLSQASDMRTATAAPVMQAATVAGSSTIDVVAGYTPEFVAENNGAGVTRLTYLIQVGNEAFRNSGVNGQLRLVGAVPVSYTNTNSNQTALQDLTGSTGSSSVAIPAALQPLRAAREQYGADIVVLARQFNTPENAGCGIAWLNGAGQTEITAADAPWAYAVISDGFDAGTDGKEYYCAEETLVHEAAHLMGSAHDQDNSKTSTGDLQYGRYPYSFGYKQGAPTGNFHTIMAYGDTGQDSVRIFSTPLRSICGKNGNAACGVAASADNARSLNQTIALVAAFRQSIVPDVNVALAGGDFNGDGRADLVRIDDNVQVRMWLKSHGSSFSQKIPAVYPAGWMLMAAADFNADSKSDLVWYNASTGALHYWLMNESGVSRFVAGGTVPSGYMPIAYKDFNGDGRADILLTDGSTQVRLWTKSASGDAFAEAQIGPHPGAAWRFAGAADVDVDGRADLFWRNSQTGELHYWLMNGSAIRSYNNAGVLDAAFSVVALADLNADGRADVIWSNGSDLRAWVKNTSGTGFTSTSFSGHPTGWTLIGTGDVDGDRKADLFWYEQSTGTIDYWLMNGGSIAGYRRSQLTAGKYVPAAAVDISNDGRADLYWVNGVSDIRMWIKDVAGNGYSDVGVNTYPGGWSVAGAGDVDLDRKADLWWFQPTTRELHYWRMNENGILGYNAAGVLPVGFTPRAVSDFNGDGRADALMSDGSTSLRMWSKNAGAGFTDQVVGGYPAGWALVGVGDVDGDGKSDLFWYNATSGALHYWLMNGATIRSYVDGGTLPGGFTPRAAGDFNGDGRADMIVASISEVRMWTKNASGNGFSSTTFSSYPPGWSLFAARDVNADGRADLFWYHEASGTMDYWLMNGASITGYFRAGVLP